MKKMFVLAALVVMVVSACESKPTDFTITKGGHTQVTVSCV